MNAASKTGIHASKKVVDSFYATGWSLRNKTTDKIVEIKHAEEMIIPAEKREKLLNELRQVL